MRWKEVLAPKFVFYIFWVFFCSIRDIKNNLEPEWTIIMTITEIKIIKNMHKEKAYMNCMHTSRYII